MCMYIRTHVRTHAHKHTYIREQAGCVLACGEGMQGRMCVCMCVCVRVCVGGGGVCVRAFFPTIRVMGTPTHASDSCAQVCYI